MECKPPLEASSYEAQNDPEAREAVRAAFYATHKARGTLGIYYYFYPEDAPERYRYPRQSRESEGRERE